MEIKLVKINNPNWVAQLGPMIEDFCAKIHMPNINYYSVVAYFQNTAQLGGELSELWVAFDSDKLDIPMGFAHWSVRGIPLVGTVYFDYLYSKANRKAVVREFIKKFLAFGKKLNSPWYMFDAISNPKLLKYFNRFAKEFNLNLIEQPYIPFLARIKPNESHNKSGNTNK